MIGHQELTHLSTTAGIPTAFSTQSPLPLQQQPPPTFGHIPYTYDERERIADALSRKLPPDCISQRSGGAAGQVKYIEGWRAIELANEIFGFNGWSMSVLNNSIDFLDNVGPSPNDPRWTVGVSCTVRITLQDGSFREDTGYGVGDNFRTKGQALEKTRKEATTDALKRTLRLFGNALGNCLHDKDFLRQVNTMPVQRKTLSTDDIYKKGSMMQQPNSQTPTGPNTNSAGYNGGPNQSPVNSPLNAPATYPPNGHSSNHSQSSTRGAPAPGPFSGIYPNNNSHANASSNGPQSNNPTSNSAPGPMGPPAVPQQQQQQGQFAGMGDANNMVRPNGPGAGGGGSGHWSMNGQGNGSGSSNGGVRADPAPVGSSPSTSANMFQPQQQSHHARPPPPAGMRGPPQQQQQGPGMGNGMHPYPPQGGPGLAGGGGQLQQQQQQQQQQDAQKRGPPQGNDMAGNMAKRMRT